jgi:hypothetical protein
LDPKIRKLQIFEEIDNSPTTEEIFKNESNLETIKNESFADDSTTLTYFEYEDLRALKNNLVDFEKLSGLKCNFDKTVIMRIGDLTGPIDPRITNLGFAIAEEVKLLGFTITQKHDIYSSNYENLLAKVKKRSIFGKCSIYPYMAK